MIICAVHSPPLINQTFMCLQDGTEIQYSLDMFCTLVALMRLYLAYRYFTRYSHWSSLSGSEQTYRICDEFKIEGTESFALKCELKERPYSVISVALAISILAFGFAMRLAELPYIATSGYDWTYLWNSMWCVIVTMSTVGFGDFVPHTHLGRTVAILACLWGNFLISLMVVSLTVTSDFTLPSHRQAFKAILQNQEESKLRDKAARAIQAFFRYYRKQNPSDSSTTRLKQELREFQTLRRHMITTQNQDHQEQSESYLI